MSGSARMAQILTGALAARKSSETAEWNPLTLKTSRRVNKKDHLEYLYPYMGHTDNGKWEM